MTASFISTGIGELDKAASEARKQVSGGKNTGKLLVPGKKNSELRIVPLVELNSEFPNVPQVIGFMQHIIYWDDASLAEVKKSNPEMEGLYPIFSFPLISSDSDIDVGHWLRKHPEVFEGAKVKTSTKFNRNPAKPMDLKEVLLTPVLWINKPATDEGNNDEKEDNIYVLKTTQKTIKDGLMEIFNAASRIKGLVINIKLAKDGMSYSVNSILPYADELPTEFGFNTEDYVGFQSRQAIVDKLALYGIIVPDVPEDKKAELDAIESMIAANKAEDN